MRLKIDWGTIGILLVQIGTSARENETRQPHHDAGKCGDDGNGDDEQEEEGHGCQGLPRQRRPPVRRPQGDEPTAEVDDGQHRGQVDERRDGRCPDHCTLYRSDQARACGSYSGL